MSYAVHTRGASDADWSFIQSHECDPLLDTSLQVQITCSTSLPSSGASIANADIDDTYDVIETSRPSFAQIAALKSAQSSHVPTPIQSPIVATRGGTTTSGTTGRGGMGISAAVAMGAVPRRYGNDYMLKKSGKKYVAVKA